MINLITGTPGAGKSYLAVSLLLDTYFYKEYGEYFLKPEYSDYTIITNIEGLELEHKSLDEILDKVPFNQFFTVPYQEKIAAKYPKIIYVIDECQRFIPPRFRDEKVVYYFDYHRHFDHTIYLITQDSRKICKEIALLHEMEYRAVKSMFQTFGVFQYLIKSNWEICGRKTVRKKKEIFDLYKSFQTPGAKTKVSKTRIPIYVIIFLVIGFGMYKMTFAGLLGSGEDAMQRNNPDYSPGQVGDRGQPPRQLAQAKPEIPKESEPDRPSQVRLRDVAAKYNETGQPIRIFAFRCPLTYEMTYPDRVHYQIIISRGEFYALLQPSDYDYTSLAYSAPEKKPDQKHDQKSSPGWGSRASASDNPTNPFRSIQRQQNH